MVIKDLNGDSLSELITTNNSDISIYNNQFNGALGRGTFNSRINFTTGSSANNNPGPIHLAVDDLDSDGKPEIAIVNVHDSSISVWLNNTEQGAIDPSSFISKTEFRTEENPMFIAIADIDNDGKNDIIATGQREYGFSILKNNCEKDKMTTSSFEKRINYSRDNYYMTLAVADFDCDGWIDILGGKQNRGFGLNRNVTDSGMINKNSFDVEIAYKTAASSSIMDIIAADLDGDGAYDFAGTNAGWNGSFSIFRNQLGVSCAPKTPILNSIESANGDEFAIQVYPNPFTDKFKVVVKDDLANASIEIFDLMGKAVMVQTMSGSELILNLTYLNAGVYLYRVVGKDGSTYTGKVIKR